MRYLTDFKVFESRDSDVSEIINDITPIVNGILLELNFKDIEGESRFVKVGNRKGPNSHYIIIKLKKESHELTWDEVSDVIVVASDYLKDNNFLYNAEKTKYWGTGVTFDPSNYFDSENSLNSVYKPNFQNIYGECIMYIYFKYEDNIN